MQMLCKIYTFTGGTFTLDQLDVQQALEGVYNSGL